MIGIRGRFPGAAKPPGAELSVWSRFFFYGRGPDCAAEKRRREKFRSLSGRVLDIYYRKGVRFHGRKEKSNEEKDSEEDPEKEVNHLVI